MLGTTSCNAYSKMKKKTQCNLTDVVDVFFFNFYGNQVKPNFPCGNAAEVRCCAIKCGLIKGAINSILL